MKTVLMILAFVAAPVWGQGSPDERVQRIMTLKYIDPVAVQNLLRDFGVDIRADRQMKVVALAGKRSAVETAEQALARLDVPGAAQKDVDLTVYFVVGRDDVGNATGAAIPNELSSTVNALKSTFPYKSYELLDALSLRSRAGTGASTSGQLSGNRLTSFSVGSVNVEGDGNMIRIDHLRAGVRALMTLGVKPEYVNVSSIDTEVVDVKEGQKLVVGRSSLEGPGKALFLVLIAKVAQ
jgi:hypothetical protein